MRKVDPQLNFSFEEELSNLYNATFLRFIGLMIFFIGAILSFTDFSFRGAIHSFKDFL